MTRIERLRIRRRMQRRIRLVVEERRMALSTPPTVAADPPVPMSDPDVTVEIPRTVVARVAVDPR